MAGFTTTSNGDWSFKFGDDFEKPKLSDAPSPAAPYMEGPGRWDNYTDKYLYEVESLVRQFFESKKDDYVWRISNTKYRRFTVKMFFQVLYGRDYNHSTSSTEDRKRFNRLQRIMRYYSSRIQNEGHILGKRHKTRVYTLSPKRYRKLQPYSLRLRMEWLAERGEVPTWYNMKVYNETLKPGHARNPRVDANMERRREKAREVYNERYRDRDH